VLLQKNVPAISGNEARAVRLIFSRWTIVLLAIAVVLPWLAIAFLPACGHAVYAIPPASPTNDSAASPVVRSPHPQTVPRSARKEQPSGAPGPSQPSTNGAVIAEIDALESESVEIAHTLIQDFPNNAAALGLIAMVCDRHGQTTRALEYWEQALHCNPNRPDLYDALATVALRKMEYEKAAELCRKGLRISARTTHLRCQLVEALNGLGRFQESVDELQIAIKLTPDIGEFHYQLGKIYAVLHEYEKAKISYEAAVALQPGSASAHYGLAIAYARLGMDEQSRRAMGQFQKLQAKRLPVQRDGNDGADDAWNCRLNLAKVCSQAATIYLDRGRPGKAESLLRRGAAVAPENIGCRMQLAQLLCRENRVPATVPILRELIGIACRTWSPSRFEEGQ